MDYNVGSIEEKELFPMTPVVNIKPPSYKIIRIEIPNSERKLFTILNETESNNSMVTIYATQTTVLSNILFDNCLFFVTQVSKMPGQSLGIFLRDGDPFTDEPGLFVSRLNENISISLQAVDQDPETIINAQIHSPTAIPDNNAFVDSLETQQQQNPSQKESNISHSSCKYNINNSTNNTYYRSNIYELSEQKNNSTSFSNDNQQRNLIGGYYDEISKLQTDIFPFQIGDRICRVRISDSAHTHQDSNYSIIEKIDNYTHSDETNNNKRYEAEKKYNLDDVVLFMSISSFLELSILREGRNNKKPSLEQVDEKSSTCDEESDKFFIDEQIRRVSFQLSDPESQSLSPGPSIDIDQDEIVSKIVSPNSDRTKEQHVRFDGYESSPIWDHLHPTMASSVPTMLNSTFSLDRTNFNDKTKSTSKNILFREVPTEDSNDSGLSSENSWLPSIISTTNYSLPVDTTNTVTICNMSAPDSFGSGNPMRTVHFAGSKIHSQTIPTEGYPSGHQIPWPYQRASLTNPRTVTFRTNQKASISSPPSPQSQGPLKNVYWPQNFYIPRHTGPLYPSQSLSDPRMLNYRWISPPAAQPYQVEMADKGIQCGPERHGYNSDTELKLKSHQPFPVDMLPLNKNQVKFSVSRTAPHLHRSAVNYSSGEEEGFYQATSPSRYIDPQQSLICPNQNMIYKQIPGQSSIEDEMRNLNIRPYMPVPMMETDFFDNVSRTELSYIRGPNNAADYSSSGYTFPANAQTDFRSTASAPSIRSLRQPSRPKEQQADHAQQSMSRLDPNDFRKIQTEQWPPVLASGGHSQRTKSSAGYVSGMLVIHVVAGIGLNSSQTVVRDLYCVLEIDSVRRARSMIRTSTEIFEWDEIFELDVEDNDWLAFLFYQWDPRNRHRLCFYGNVALRQLIERFRHSYTNSEKLALYLEPKGVLFIELLYLKINEVFQRFKMPVNSDALFGVPLEVLVSRDLNRQGESDGQECRVPIIVRRCTEEVEKRGLDVVSIYRLSGAVKLKIRIREMLEQDVVAADLSADTVPDIHAITAVLRDFLRELPEPLFTNALYRMILDALQVSLPGDNYAGAKLMLNILDCLPIVNQDTILHLLDHLKRVSSRSEVNKMTNEALAASLGPVLFFPSPEEAKKLDKSLLDPKKQAQTLLYILNIWPDESDHQYHSRDLKSKESIKIHSNSTPNAQKTTHTTPSSRYSKPSPSTVRTSPNQSETTITTTIPRKPDTAINSGINSTEHSRNQNNIKNRRPILSNSRRSNSLEMTERDQSRGRSATMSSGNHSRLTSRSSSRDRKVVLVDESSMPYL